MDEELNMSLFQDVDLEIESIPEEIRAIAAEDDAEENTTQENTTAEENDEDLADDTPDEIKKALADTEETKPGEEEKDPSEEVAGEDENEGGDDDSPNLYSSLAKVLNEQGLLPSLNLQDNKIESADDISNAIKGEIDSNVRNQLIKTLGEDGYEAITSGVPLEQLAKNRETQMALDSITEDSLADDIELSKRVIYQDFINQGISEERARKLVQRVSATGEDTVIEDAKESLNNIKTFTQEQLKQQAERNKQAAVEQAKQQEELDNKLKSTIYNSSELIKGLKLNKATQDRVYNSITNNVADGDGFETKLIQDRKSNPIEFDAKLYYLYEVTNGFKDIDAIVKRSTTSATSELEKAIQKSRSTDTSNPSFVEDSQSYLGDGDHEIVFD